MRLQPIFLVVLVCGMIFITGCTQQEVQVTPTPTPTPEAPPPDISPLPTDTVPTEYRVFVTVTRNTYSFHPLIKVEFRGGQGMGLLSSLDAEVIREDGSAGTASLQRPAIGEFMEVQGSTGKDRVIVHAHMMNGARYRIYDDVLEFRT
ncbi:MAG: hypothetical protein A4E36_01461 [Methanoregulaceae archaeon PtaB.Bin009]|jgi:hypothetical protein|nr:MAG: hypothetical protein A4E36_01461 [Methanoregulaceae archaeon PtaB.Bin009]OPY41707.1 MAG: hypothetical protein A4E41_00793 [Methanoregulaceae archaeon PtaU1.Bin066]HNQ29295.1 hypothetical protein [Methanolinea sp.]HNS82607.1 hypothetical protein [Methanolinea sp.]